MKKAIAMIALAAICFGNAAFVFPTTRTAQDTVTRTKIKKKNDKVKVKKKKTVIDTTKKKM